MTSQSRYYAPACVIGSRTFVWGQKTFVMGIVNVTPDSFSGDGILAGDSSDRDEIVERAVRQALDFVQEGADIIDIGGESTRPGAQPVSVKEEITRVVPVIEALRERSDVPISIDTYKAAVAEAALEAGADLVNDVWGLQADRDMAGLVAEAEVPVVLMHNRSRADRAVHDRSLGGRYVDIVYDDVVEQVLGELKILVQKALAAGISKERILVDPGIGFGKTVEQNLSLLRHLDALRTLHLPVLLGASRKSFIGYTLDLPPEERLEGSLAAVAVGIALGGVDIVRVHDVKATVRVARMADAIMRAD